MAEVDSSFIKRGFWIDHSYGTILGSTITTDGPTANIIIALVAIVISVAMTSAWNLLIFMFHQSRATSQPKDGLFRQQQILLRSLPSPGSTITDSIKLLWFWRSRISSATSRCTIPTLVALVFSLGSLAASVFSSNIITSTNVPVLINGNSCASFNSTVVRYDEDSNALLDFLKSFQTSTMLFQTECYSPGSLPTFCDFYINPRINFSMTVQRSSPFAPELSWDNSTGALVLDSGYLDSNTIFGINAPLSNRVQFRRRASCVPLNTQDHMAVCDGASFLKQKYTYANVSLLPPEEFWVFQYGPSGMPENATLAQSTAYSNVTQTYTTIVNVAYQYQSVFYGMWQPIDGLNLADADVTTVGILTNSVVSFTPIDGPIYSAHVFVPADNYHGHGYRSDGPGGVLGCIEQYDYCIRNGSGMSECTGFHGSGYEDFEESLPSANPSQLATLHLFSTATALNGFNMVLQNGDDILNSTNQVRSGLIPGLPSNQWILDVQRLEGFVWAGLQVALVWHSTGYANAGPAMVIEPFTAAEKQLCNNQKVIKAGGFANINVFGLAFTLAMSAFLIVLDYGALRGLFFLPGLRKRLAPGVGFWTADGMYQLQRVAYEGIGAGHWSHTDQEIPLCKASDRFRDLPASK